MKSPDRSKATSYSGFTLVELLVVIAIIGVLVALLLPAVQAAREAARRAQCMSNMHNVALAVLNFEAAVKKFPEAMTYDDSNTSIQIQLLREFGPNWVISSLPYMEEQALHDAFDLKQIINSAANRTPRGQFLPVLLCPSDTNNRVRYNGSANPVHGDNWARGNYAANVGNGPIFRRSPDGIYGPDSPGWKNWLYRGVMGPNVGLAIRQIKDGMSKTVMLGEVRAGPIDGDPRGVWALGHAGTSLIAWYGARGDANGPNVCTDFADDVQTRLQCRTADRLYLRQICMPCDGYGAFDQATTRSQHVGGVLMAYCDGRIDFVDNNIETTGSYGPCCTIWDHMILSGDQGRNLISR